MQRTFKRRTFLKSTATVGVGALLAERLASLNINGAAAGKPVVVASANGLEATAKAMEMIQQGKDALDAVIAGVNIVEADPDRKSVV